MNYKNYKEIDTYYCTSTPGVDPMKQRPIKPCERQAYKNHLNSFYGTSAFFRGIKKVIFNDPATIVLWADGTKTVVKCQDGDVFDPEKGLAMAISKKCFGNMGRYYEVFKKWLPEEEEEEKEYGSYVDIDGNKITSMLSEALNSLTIRSNLRIPYDE